MLGETGKAISVGEAFEKLKDALKKGEDKLSIYEKIKNNDPVAYLFMIQAKKSFSDEQLQFLVACADLERIDKTENERAYRDKFQAIMTTFLRVGGRMEVNAGDTLPNQLKKLCENANFNLDEATSILAKIRIVTETMLKGNIITPLRNIVDKIEKEGIPKDYQEKFELHFPKRGKGIALSSYDRKKREALVRADNPFKEKNDKIKDVVNKFLSSKKKKQDTEMAALTEKNKSTTEELNIPENVEFRRKKIVALTLILEKCDQLVVEQPKTIIDIDHVIELIREDLTKIEKSGKNVGVTSEASSQKSDLNWAMDKGRNKSKKFSDLIKELRTMGSKAEKALGVTTSKTSTSLRAK